MHEIFLCLNIWETGLPIVGEERHNQRNTRKIKISFPLGKLRLRIVQPPSTPLGQGCTLFQLKLTGNEIIISTSPTYLTSRLKPESAPTQLFSYSLRKNIFTFHAKSAWLSQWLISLNPNILWQFSTFYLI